ncbi:MFS transporter [Amycolatopsis sp. CA-128772]|uniref:MFS transporter n=1 Tax=Amycolatopsis sp. CA-128772 TaxID=2073159 RepID=UPI0013049977|nr:MFS transporter [Amycolatopsis sp. CA-128772]
MTVAAGGAAAAALGKVAPVSGPVRGAFGLSATWLGLVISIITFVAALFALPVGEWLRRRAAGAWVAAGLAVLAVAGGLMVAAAPAAGVLVGLRVAEGVGYLLVMVGGPVVLMSQVPERRLAPVLAVWGACIPAGLALSAFAGGVLGSAWGWRGWFLLLAVVCAALAAVAGVTSRGDRTPSSPGSPGHRVAAGPLLLGTGFALTALISVAVLSLLPLYLGSAFGLPPGTAGALTSAVAVASVPGSLLAGALLRRGVSPQALGTAALSCPVFAGLAFGGALSPAATVVMAVLLLFAAGIGVGAAYGALPSVVARPDALPAANGALVQLGSAGTLLAPPLFAAVTGLARWERVAFLVLPAAVAGLALLIRATARSSRDAGDPVPAETEEKGNR